MSLENESTTKNIFIQHAPVNFMNTDMCSENIYRSTVDDLLNTTYNFGTKQS